MLANGIKLGYKTTGSTYTNLTGLQSVPEMGSDPEKVEVTCLADSVKKYEFGIGDYGDLEYTFLFKNDSAESPYRVLRGFADNKTVVDFEEELPDGTKYDFKAQCNIKVSGGEVNGAMTFTLQLALQSEISISDPVSS